jgi:hypothetical protein
LLPILFFLLSNGKFALYYVSVRAFFLSHSLSMFFIVKKYFSSLPGELFFLLPAQQMAKSSR